MEILKGISVSPGVAFGPVFILGREEVVVGERHIPKIPDEVKREIERFRAAVEATVASYKALRDDTAKRFRPDYASVFDAHIAILRDPGLMKKVEEIISSKGLVAEHAVSRVFRTYTAKLEKIDEEYLSQRADDIRDIQRRLISNLSGVPIHQGFQNVKSKFVLVTRFLSPTDAATLPKDKVLAIATDKGGPLGHASLFARALNIPAVVGLKVVSHHVSTGDIIVVNGNLGEVIISPDDATLEKCRLDMRDEVYIEHIAFAYKHKETITRDGHDVAVRANVGSADDVAVAMEHGADGVGLFRTEMIFFNRDKTPGEEEQYLEYLRAMETVHDEVITFRTFDFGSDKVPPEYENYYPDEMNPALGLRGIRLAMKAPHVFRIQLKAILRAAAECAARRNMQGPFNVRIMFPMVTHPREFLWAKNQVAAVREELESAGGRSLDGLAIGAMFEVPGIFYGAQYIRRELDFASIGTNDLIQYLFAADRTNEEVAEQFVPGHKALLDLIEMLKRSISPDKISVCGDMAADPVFLGVLLAAGITEFSVPFTMVPKIKHAVRAVSVAECKECLKKALASGSPELDLSSFREYMYGAIHSHAYGED